ncbi:sporulation protein [Actinoplanes sp. GCM10030250]|uniref:sporulation protein n=1 Tax=Actinoplanes sp. GCM10030250 TaxID=3273376 RepID=UPI00360BF09A
MTSKISSSDILEKARAGADNATAAKVFGEPVERDGVIVIPVAMVSGGGGGGSGSGSGPAGKKSARRGSSADSSATDSSATDGSSAGGSSSDGSGSEPEGEGSGGGFGFSARPAGVYVLKNGKVTWQPAVDVNRIILGAQFVLITALLVARSVLRNRRQHQ